MGRDCVGPGAAAEIVRLTLHQPGWKEPIEGGIREEVGYS